MLAAVHVLICHVAGAVLREGRHTPRRNLVVHAVAHGLIHRLVEVPLFTVSQLPLELEDPRVFIEH